MSSKLTVVVGGQYGSEGKGAVAAWVSRTAANPDHQVVGVRVGGPNAGHTVMGDCPFAALDQGPCKDCNGWGHPWRLRQVPVAAVTNRRARLAIAAGSEVDLQVLRKEVEALDRAGYGVAERLFVDSSATILEPFHRNREAVKGLALRIGSTAKGIGAARADRLWRTAAIARDRQREVEAVIQASPIDTQEWLRQLLETGGCHIVIEGTQGYGLGLHTTFYPYVTSGDCRAIDFLAQAGISPWARTFYGSEVDFRTVVCFRPYPIRVAGNSGPMVGETTWGALGLPTERTTVTGNVRRVGEWDEGLVEWAIRANGGHGPHLRLALTMADHLVPDLAGLDDWEKVPEDVEFDLTNWAAQKSGLSDASQRILLSHNADGVNTGLFGTGPATMLGDL